MLHMRSTFTALLAILSFPFALQAGPSTHHGPHGRRVIVVRTVNCGYGNNCRQPMAMAAFGTAKKTVEEQNFDYARLATAKQVGSSNCFSTRQVMELMDLFKFEDARLDFAKFAYDHVTDPGNYHLVTTKLRFSGSVETLNSYLQTR